jgi:hypothetical protein
MLDWASVSPSLVQQVVPSLSFCCAGGLVTRMVVCLPAAEFRPCMFYVLGFALFSVTDIHLMVL